jgi:hypothetical protein
MLRTPTPFPQVGSYALIELDGRHHLARIQARTCDADTMISLPLLPAVASGTRKASLDDLIDGTPLSERERRELEALTIDLAGGNLTGRRRKAAEEREDALRDRLIHAPILAEMMERLPDPIRRASRVAA